MLRGEDGGDGMLCGDFVQARACVGVRAPAIRTGLCGEEGDIGAEGAEQLIAVLPAQEQPRALHLPPRAPRTAMPPL